MPLVKSSPRRPSSRVRASSRQSWTEKSANGLRLLQVRSFSKLNWLVHGFSTRPGGVSSLQDERVLNLGFTEWDARENVLENRRLFQAALGAANLQPVCLQQVHSDVILVFDSAPAGVCRGDASLTNRPDLLLCVQTADCVPILLVDSRKRAVAAVHAGWRGTLQRIVAKTIGAMRMHFGTNPSDILAAIGPAIGPCCYEVGVEVAAQFLSQFPDAASYFDELRTGEEPNPLQWLNMAPPGHQPPPKSVFLDLGKANRSQLLGAGVRPNNISTVSLCTACRPDLLFSYRKQSKSTGRLMAAIGLRR